MDVDVSRQTIAAVGSARGAAAISVLRLSGPDALRVLEDVFRPAGGALPCPARELRHGVVVDPESGETLDSVMAAAFPGPASYSGEDMAEIHTHGGMFVTGEVFELLLRRGARPALPGEFTLRAFANGKLDLTQAEAVNDVVSARNRHFLCASMGALSGRLGEAVRAARARLVELLASIEVVIEYPDEDVPDVPAGDVSMAIEASAAEIRKLLDGYAPANYLNRGPQIAIVGRPNVGKSSIMNRLLGSDRSIIHDSPGTTRDLVGDRLTVNGIDALIMDTAGITDASDPVEREGVRRSMEFALAADEVFFILDSSEPLTPSDFEIANQFRKNKKEFTTILNKADLPRRIDIDAVKTDFGEFIEVSAKTGDSVELAKLHISDIVNSVVAGVSDVLVTNARHKQLLEQALNSLQEAISNSGMPQDVIAIDLRDAVTSLGLITGENTTQDLLDTIFSNFCVGK